MAREGAMRMSLGGAAVGSEKPRPSGGAEIAAAAKHAPPSGSAMGGGVQCKTSLRRFPTKAERHSMASCRLSRLTCSGWKEM